MKDIVIIANFCRDFSESDNGRFMYLCKELSKDNNVEIITSDFSHGTKNHKKPSPTTWSFSITYLHEPGYKSNICLRRFYSHHIWGKNVKAYLETRKNPEIVYCAVPSLTAAFYAAKYCKKNKVKFVIDIQDLWPEAFKMVFHIPIISNLLFLPFKLLADTIYKSADSICAVSNTYVNRALKVSKKCREGYAVFLGTDLSVFDENVKNNVVKIKPRGEIWLGYCGTLGASYDLICAIDALKLLGEKAPKFIVMGDGPRRREFEDYAKQLGVDANFTGRLPYPKMCALLSECDIAINPITGNSVASIINKHGDYAASGLPVLNTQESAEYRNLVETYQMGFNCKNGNSNDLAEKLEYLVLNEKERARMGQNSRKCAEEKFDRKTSYTGIMNLLHR